MKCLLAVHDFGVMLVASQSSVPRRLAVAEVGCSVVLVADKTVWLIGTVMAFGVLVSVSGTLRGTCNAV